MEYAMTLELPDPRRCTLQDLEPFRDINCIVSDIDGTMITAGDSLFPQIVSFIRRLEKRNVIFTIATGRTVYGTEELLRRIPMKRGTPAGFYNGAVILTHEDNTIIQSDTIDEETIYRIASYLLCTNVPGTLFIYSFRKEIFNGGDRELFEDVYGICGNMGPCPKTDVNGQPVHWIGTDSLGNMGIISVLIDISKMSEAEISAMNHFCSTFQNLHVTSSGNGFIEITNTISNKGNLISYLKKDRDVRVLAVGDNRNDYDMFERADVSVAVQNAPEEIFGKVNYICSRAAAEGMTDLLSVIWNAKKYLR